MSILQLALVIIHFVMVLAFPRVATSDDIPDCRDIRKATHHLSLDAPPLAVSYTQDGKHLIVASGEDVKLYSAHDFKQWVRIGVQMIPQAVVPIGSRQLLVGGCRLDKVGSVALWDWKDGKLAKRISIKDEYEVRGLSCDFERRFAAITMWFDAGERALARLWNIRTDKEITLPSDCGSDAFASAISPDGNTMMIGKADGRLWYVSLETMRIIRKVEAHKFRIYGIQFTPDGKRSATISTDKSIHVWDVHTGDKIATFRRHTDTIECIAFSPDGRLVATGGWDKEVWVWQANDARPVFRIRDVCKDVVTSLAFSPNGKMLISGGGNDHSIKVWRMDEIIPRE